VDTQLEHKQVAVACAQAISAVFPMVNDFVYKEESETFVTIPDVIKEDLVEHKLVNWWQHLFNFYKH
jgi:hypothetical protein